MLPNYCRVDFILILTILTLLCLLKMPSVQKKKQNRKSFLWRRLFREKKKKGQLERIHLENCEV